MVVLNLESFLTPTIIFGREKNELDQRDKRLIKYLVKHKHTSTFEHNVITFKFVVPLFVRSQHHRHRTWSYNEISRRYTEKNMPRKNKEEVKLDYGDFKDLMNLSESGNMGLDRATRIEENKKKILDKLLKGDYAKQIIVPDFNTGQPQDSDDFS